MISKCERTALVLVQYECLSIDSRLCAYHCFPTHGQIHESIGGTQLASHVAMILKIDVYISHILSKFR